MRDENTIGVVGILGSTFDGSYRRAHHASSVRRPSAPSQERTPGPRHPRSTWTAPPAPWSLPLPGRGPGLGLPPPRVASINTSGHKYGLVYPGVGWALWRDKEALPEELVFLASTTWAATCPPSPSTSRPGAQVVAQYYTFLRLGREGYRAVQRSTRNVAQGPRQTASKPCATSNSSPVATSCRSSPSPQPRNVKASSRRFDVSRRLRERGLAGPGVHLPGKPRGPLGPPHRLPQRASRQTWQNSSWTT
ncbi:pyridoxal-dependent decarboxylase [Streptomyces sp. L7]